MITPQNLKGNGGNLFVKNLIQEWKMDETKSQ